MNTKAKLFISACSIIAAASVMPSCKSTKSTATATAPKEINCATTPTYAADIKPISDGACGNSCHSAQRKAKGIDLSSLEGTKAIAATPAFLGAINQEKGFAPMPKMHPKLDDASIEKITCWVKGGMN